MNIEDYLPVSPTFKEAYYEIAEEGKKELKDKKVVFSLLARNVERQLERNIIKLIDLVEDYVKDWRIVIYENDSEDQTAKVLSELSEKYPLKIIYKTETHNRMAFGPVKKLERVEALSEYRNHNLEFIKNNLFDFDYVIVCDSDFVDISKNGFYNSMGLLKSSNLSAVCGNSFQIKIVGGKQSLWNYDSWAFRGTWWQDLNSVKNEYIQDQMLWFGFWILPVGSQPIIVNSGFGGMAIYKRDVYVQAQYQGLDCEHVVFHWNLARKVKDFRMALNPSQVMLMQ